MKLSNISTKQLVEELARREGVKIKIAEPHKKEEVSVSGPAIIMIVTD